jgi:hypothetical protein
VKFVIYLFAAVGPFFLLPIQFILPFPYLVEELYKLGLLLSIYQIDRKSLILDAIILGLLFSFSESIFYLPSINLETFVLRFVITLPMHLLTIVIMALIIQKNIRLAPIGLLLAILIHYLFNLVATII